MSSEATPSTALYDFWAWVEVNKKRLGMGAIILLLVIGGFWLARYSARQRELAAGHALSDLVAESSSGPRPGGLAAASLLELAGRFPKTRAAEHARLLAAGQLFADGKYAEAREQFERFLREHGSSPMTAAAAFGAATCLDALDKVDEAQAAYQAVIIQHPNDPVAPLARLHLARLHESRKQPELALKQYEEMTRPQAMSVWMVEATRRREHLLRQHPELAARETALPVGIAAPPAGP